MLNIRYIFTMERQSIYSNLLEKILTKLTTYNTEQNVLMNNCLINLNVIFGFILNLINTGYTEDNKFIVEEILAKINEELKIKSLSSVSLDEILQNYIKELKRFDIIFDFLSTYKITIFPSISNDKLNNLFNESFSKFEEIYYNKKMNLSILKKLNLSQKSCIAFSLPYTLVLSGYSIICKNIKDIISNTVSESHHKESAAPLYLKDITIKDFNEVCNNVFNEDLSVITLYIDFQDITQTELDSLDGALFWFYHRSLNKLIYTNETFGKYSFLLNKSIDDINDYSNHVQKIISNLSSLLDLRNTTNNIKWFICLNDLFTNLINHKDNKWSHDQKNFGDFMENILQFSFGLSSCWVKFLFRMNHDDLQNRYITYPIICANK